MTTIFANGDYLVADHRVSIFMDSPEENHIAASTGEKPRAVQDDILLKIRLVEKTNLRSANGHKILAYAFAGFTEVEGAFKNILEHSKPSRITDWVRVLKDTAIAVGDGGQEVSAIVCLTDAGETDEYALNPDGTVDIVTYPNGKICLQGSGGDKVQRAVEPWNLSCPSPAHVMALAHRLDEDTAPSYSVYGRNESMLYTCVEPPASVYNTLADEELERIAVAVTLKKKG